ncbi:uncharacterized protein LTR77_006011 [Saxophila tyrrhenica]|uniref:Uncharacterized protein n=1 Tax=Saxophila tyrrhenica TaxID=1690608 RepID=A0AAV9P7A5_9PEZI|nr:hypothetical protein LTR77_006011 [Saxophila tyrrhenica]
MHREHNNGADDAQSERQSSITDSRRIYVNRQARLQIQNRQFIDELCAPALEDVGNCIPATLLNTVLHGVVAATRLSDDTVEPFRQIISDRITSSQNFGNWRHDIDSECASMDDSRQVGLLALAIAHLVHQSRSARQTPREDLDVIWWMIHDALQSPVMQSAYLSVNRSAQGFLAIPLCSILDDGKIVILFRLHVWLPDGQRGAPGFEVHSHQPFAQSWVLAGRARNYAYEVKPSSDEEQATHARYALEWTSGAGLDTTYKTHQMSSKSVNTGEYVVAEPVSDSLNQNGSSYTVPAAAFHSTTVESDRLHATLFLFDGTQGFVKDAPVLGPKDAESNTQVRDAAGVSAVELATMVEEKRLNELFPSIMEFL